MNRVPAYTDRILFESLYEMPQKNPIMNIYYGRAEMCLSDHKPVTGLFEAKIKVVNQLKKQELSDTLSGQYEAMATESENHQKETFLSMKAGRAPPRQLPYPVAPAQLKKSQSVLHFLPDSSEIDDDADFHPLKLEEYDLGQVDEYKRQANLMVDYELFQKGQSSAPETEVQTAFTKDALLDRGESIFAAPDFVLDGLRHRGTVKEEAKVPEVAVDTRRQTQPSRPQKRVSCEAKQAQS